MLKSMVYVATRGSDSFDLAEAKDPWYILAIVRGDHEVNEAKLKQAVEKIFNEPVVVQMAPEALARKDDWALGFVGPHAFRKRDGGCDDTYMIVDPDAAQDTFWAAGANEMDHHVKYFNWKRDVGHTPETNKRMIVADIRNAAAGDPAPANDGGMLQTSRGIEIGHVFKLGTKYSDALDAKFLDDKGQSHPMIMGCYGIGIGRILISAIENSHDDKGIIWPAAIAPYSVVITPIRYEGEVKDAADKLYAQLNAAGIDAILDDRDARPGFKFADADLVGFPVRINIGDRGLKEGKVELKKRTAAEAEMVALENCVQAVSAALR
jgi:prolyl-tRNA synthetase